MVDQEVKGKEVVFGYSLSDISILEVSLKNLADELPAEIAYTYTLAVNHNVNSEQQYIQLVVESTLIRADSNDELANIKVGYRFDTKNFNVLKLDGNSLPIDLANALNGICISTTRGIFFSALRGTNLQDKIMPVIDISAFQRTQ